MNIEINIKSEKELKKIKDSNVFEMIREHFRQFNQGIFVFSIKTDKIEKLKIIVKKANYEETLRVLEEIADTGLEYFISKLFEISRKGKKRTIYDGLVLEKK